MGRPEVLDTVDGMGLTVFNGEMNVNIVGVRSVSRVANAFDDHLHLCFQSGGEWVEKVYVITTDPGTYWLENPSRVEGTAIMVPGQYRGVYQVGWHPNPNSSSRYEALVQTGGEVAVYRDGNRDNILDPEAQAPSWGWFGINIHRANAHNASPEVNKWSAGCQVFQDPGDFDEFLSIVKSSMAIYGDSVTYTLIGD